MTKRLRDAGDVLMDRKRHCFVSQRHLKRRTPFNDGMGIANKRFRATEPNAVETMAYVIPHVKELQNRIFVLTNENNLFKTENENLRKRSATLARAYQACLAQNASLNQQLNGTLSSLAVLRRELDMAKYRLSLGDRTHCSVNP